MLPGQNQLTQLTKHKVIRLFIDFKAPYESHKATNTVGEGVEDQSTTST